MKSASHNEFLIIDQLLEPFILNRSKFGHAYGLDNMLKIMEKLGNPQDSYKTIHIAGTSGKTSTAYYIASLLQKSGNKVGLTISPHVDSVNERVQINLVPLEKDIFYSELEKLISIVNSLDISPSYFEILVAFAFWEFARQKVDYAVIEVGLGGQTDGTNVINRNDKVSVLTDIGLDHVERLADNLSGIAEIKAGIILPGSVAFSLRQNPEVDKVFLGHAQAQGAEIHQLNYLDQEIPPDSGMPLFQQRNWYLAKTVAEYVIERDKKHVLSEAESLSSTKQYIPARMEQIYQAEGGVLILDGSHNGQKMHALVESISFKYPRIKFAVLLAIVDGKDIRPVLAELLPITDYLIITHFATLQDSPKNAIDPGKIELVAKEVGHKDIKICKDPELAYSLLQTSKSTHKLVTGSFYLLNHIRPLIKT